jgi:hypothetical protein
MMHTNWQVTKHNCHKDPIPHIYCKNFIKLDIYDRLYEQWNNIEHERWKTFIDQNHINVYFHEDFIRPFKPKQTAGYIGYWFFRQRTDKSSAEDILISNGKQEKILTYYQNTLMVFEANSSLVVKTRRDKLPTRPFCELYFSKETNQKIKELLS